MSALDGDTLVAWHSDKFAALELCDAELGILSCMSEQVIPNGERFLGMWFRLSEDHAKKRRERERRSPLTTDPVDPAGRRWVLSLKQTLAESLRLPVAERPAFIREKFSTEADGDRAAVFYRCPKCRDHGFVPVWDRATMAGLLRGQEPEEVTWFDAVAACSCARGKCVWERYDQRIARLGEKDYHIWCGDEDSKAKAWSLADAHRSGQRQKYQEFADWNNSEVA